MIKIEDLLQNQISLIKYSSHYQTLSFLENIGDKFYVHINNQGKSINVSYPVKKQPKKFYSLNETSIIYLGYDNSVYHLNFKDDTICNLYSGNKPNIYQIDNKVFIFDINQSKEFNFFLIHTDSLTIERVFQYKLDNSKDMFISTTGQFVLVDKENNLLQFIESIKDTFKTFENRKVKIPYNIKQVYYIEKNKGLLLVEVNGRSKYLHFYLDSSKLEYTILNLEYKYHIFDKILNQGRYLFYHYSKGLLSYFTYDPKNNQLTDFLKSDVLFISNIIQIDDRNFYFLGSETFSKEEIYSYNIQNKIVKKKTLLNTQNVSNLKHYLKKKGTFKLNYSLKSDNLYYINSSNNGKLIILIHGGPREYDSFAYNPYIPMFLKLGYSIIQVNYRGSYGFGEEFEQELYNYAGIKDIEDIIGSINKFCEIFNQEFTQIYTCGFSYGGYLSIKISNTYNKMFAGAISVNGVYDWLIMHKHSSLNQKKYIERLFGKKKDYYINASILNTHTFNTNNLLIHGKKDNIVPIDSLSDFLSLSDKLGYTKVYNYQLLENSGHFIVNKEDFKMLYFTIKKFLSK